MRLAYFECFAGASGDMILGSLIDAGVELHLLLEEIAGLGLDHYDLHVEKVVKRGIGGTQVLVRVDDYHHGHVHRSLRDIEEIISGSSLDEEVKDKSIRIFTRLAEAEAKVHRTTVDEIRFHEIGAMDTIIDVVGSVAGLAALGTDMILCSPLHVGSGTVQCAHGTLPVPAPATAELIKGKPIYSTNVQGELLTPTGAAILTTLASGFGPMPAMVLDAIGYGAGASDPAVPNLLRLFVGRCDDAEHGFEAERVAVVETNIDDMNPQMYDYLIERILRLGALDVFLIPLQMKKNRPGIMLCIICGPELVNRMAEFLVSETTSIGLRWRIDDRLKVGRQIKKIQTEFGPIRFKVACLGDTVVNVAPEYDDCKRVALEHKIPLKEVMERLRKVSVNLDQVRISSSR